jgi:hypothetical protein
MHDNYLDTFTISLDRVAHQWAAKFAAGQTSIAKGRRVYLNTLAVCAVRQYLSCVCQLEIDLRLSDCWQVELQSMMNVADLVIPNVGTIECIAVLPNTNFIQLVPETIDERIGYVFVQFNEHLDRVEILGFLGKTPLAAIDLDRDCLQSIDDLLDVIYDNKINNIREFLDGIFNINWEPIENLILAPDREFSIRNKIELPTNSSYDSIRSFTASKTIDLRANIGNVPLLILLGLNEEYDRRIKVRIRLHAAEGITLPPNLKLILQSANGDILSEIQYPQQMNFIQLQSFKIQPGTQFKIRVELENSSFVESFVA